MAGGLLSYLTIGTSLLFISLLETLALLRPSPHLRPPLLLSSAAVAALLLPSSALFLLFPAAAAAALFPPPLLDLLLSFAFAQQLLPLASAAGDGAGAVDGRYFCLLLVPAAACSAASFAAAARPRSPAPRLARALGLALLGSWCVQMGFSFFTTAVAHGCSPAWDDGGGFRVWCDGHESYHRGAAIATLQFNCHLAGIVLVGVGVYGAVERRRRGGGGEAGKALGRDVQLVSSYSLVSEGDDDEEEDMVRAEELERKGNEDAVLTFEEGNARKGSRS